MPVMLPPGRARLSTRPTLTGSVPTKKTIGTVWVAALAASAPGVLRAGLKNLHRDDKWSFCLTAGTLCPANQEKQ